MRSNSAAGRLIEKEWVAVPRRTSGRDRCQKVQIPLTAAFATAGGILSCEAVGTTRRSNAGKVGCSDGFMTVSRTWVDGHALD